jgi:hypothetical protein
MAGLMSLYVEFDKLKICGLVERGWTYVRDLIAKDLYITAYNNWKVKF